MSEWPKVIERFEDPEGPPKRYEVVPADLARELYEELICELNRQGGPLEVAERQYSADSALARYEREVGK